MIIVATTALPAVDRLNTDRWNAAHSCQKKHIFAILGSKIFFFLKRNIFLKQENVIVILFQQNYFLCDTHVLLFKLFSLIQASSPKLI